MPMLRAAILCLALLAALAGVRTGVCDCQPPTVTAVAMEACCPCCTEAGEPAPARADDGACACAGTSLTALAPVTVEPPLPVLTAVALPSSRAPLPPALAGLPRPSLGPAPPGPPPDRCAPLWLRDRRLLI